MRAKDWVQFKNDVIMQIGQADKLRLSAGNKISGMYVEGMRVGVRIRHGQKHLTMATVAGHPSWEDGHIMVKLDSTKENSRQKFRSVHIMNVFTSAELP